jgi:hypothetical protein
VNKKFLILVVFGIISILLGGMNSTILIGTQYTATNPGYFYSIAPWWNTSWSYRKLIFINHSQVDSDLNNFPILVNITDTDLRDDAQDDGDDISFVICDGFNIQLNHEIEHYDNTSGKLVAWVNVTNISSSRSTTIYMYYGNSGCSSQENITGVWDANYTMVQHLNESSGTLFDSTNNDNDGTNSGAEYIATAKIAGGYDFVANSKDKIVVADNPTLNITESLTISAWIKTSTLSQQARIVTKGKSTTNAYILYSCLNSNDKPYFSIWDEGVKQSAYSNYVVTDNIWHYVVGTFNGSQIEIYIDGELNNTAEYIGDIDIVSYDLAIPSDEQAPANYFEGIIDEVRISNTTRSTAWISTSYNTMHNTSTFLIIQNEEIQS